MSSAAVEGGEGFVGDFAKGGVVGRRNQPRGSGHGRVPPRTLRWLTPPLRSASSVLAAHGEALAPKIAPYSSASPSQYLPACHWRQSRRRRRRLQAPDRSPSRRS